MIDTIDDPGRMSVIDEGRELDGDIDYLASPHATW